MPETPGPGPEQLVQPLKNEQKNPLGQSVEWWQDWAWEQNSLQPQAPEPPVFLFEKQKQLAFTLLPQFVNPMLQLPAGVQTSGLAAKASPGMKAARARPAAAPAALRIALRRDSLSSARVLVTLSNQFAIVISLC